MRIYLKEIKNLKNLKTPSNYKGGNVNVLPDAALIKLQPQLHHLQALQKTPNSSYFVSMT